VGGLDKVVRAHLSTIGTLRATGLAPEAVGPDLALPEGGGAAWGLGPTRRSAAERCPDDTRHSRRSTPATTPPAIPTR
jgi:hypothetical protein